MFLLLFKLVSKHLILKKVLLQKKYKKNIYNFFDTLALVISLS